ncbi:uncharacterized protein LOC144615119 [Panthera onca]
MSARVMGAVLSSPPRIPGIRVSPAAFFQPAYLSPQDCKPHQLTFLPAYKPASTSHLPWAPRTPTTYSELFLTLLVDMNDSSCLLWGSLNSRDWEANSSCLGFPCG